MDSFNNLNEKQIEAVKATEGYVRVIAGAGSGKTKLLVSRYAYLVSEYGIDPANMLCVTFTNKAAAEMRSRVRALIGPDNDSSLICTYHGFCARLIREDAGKLFLPNSFQIIDAYQQKQILEDIYQKHELKLDHASFESILKKIHMYKSDDVYVTLLCDPAKVIQVSSGDIDSMIIDEYLQRQKASYLLDFDDLIAFAIFLLKTNAEVRHKWQERLNYILVDEFQDSTRRELRLVEILSENFKNLMIVGDPDQNIYEWRGSDVKLLVDFDKEHEDTKTIYLTQNYRSTPQILKCANELISKNEYRLKKDLFTDQPDGTPVTHYHFKSEYEETNKIAELIRDLHKNGRKYSDIAILYRSNFLSRVIEKKLVETGIPYEIFGGVKFYQRMEVQDVIAYLRMVAFADDLSFKRIVNTPRRKFGRQKMNVLESLRAESGDISLYETLKKNHNDLRFKGSEIGSFITMIDSMHDQISHLRIADIVAQTTEKSGYEEYIRSLGDEERLENLSEFKRIAAEFERDFGEDVTLPEFLQQLSLQSAEDNERGRDCVKLMTIHTAKGLEFPVVFVTGLSEGIFPSARTIEERKKLGLEEERRLCYVAITRACEQLFLTDSEGLSPNNISKVPSRFLSDIGENYYVRIGAFSRELERERWQYINKLNNYIFPGQLLTTGDTVEHRMFGRGVILDVDNNRKSYRISFDNGKIIRNITSTYFCHDSKQISFSEEKPNDEIILTDELTDVAFELEESASFDERTENDSIDTIIQTEEIECNTSRSNSDREEDYELIKCLLQNPEKNEPEDYFIEANRELTEEENKLLREKLANATNLWKRPDVPHSGWKCIGISDLGAPAGICEMCGHQIIRYVHHMIHDNYRALDVGCICAGKMEGDINAAKKRERELKSRETRRINFKKKKWKRSINNNQYIKYKGHIIVLYTFGSGKWKYSVDSVFDNTVFPSRAEVIDAVFERIDKES